MQGNSWRIRNRDPSSIKRMTLLCFAICVTLYVMWSLLEATYLVMCFRINLIPERLHSIDQPEITRIREATTLAFNKTLTASRNKEGQNLPHLYCPTQALGSSFSKYVITASRIKINAMLNEQLVDVSPGGIWTPRLCRLVNSKVLPYCPIALIVPIRRRQDVVMPFLFYMHSFLRIQNVPHIIITVEQVDANPFNRGAMMNIGFLIAPSSVDCFVFSDIDMLPERFDTTYTCNQNVPRHMSAYLSKFGYKRPYKTYFGGIASFTRQQFTRINGFSNKFWGWGGEDDDLYKRVYAKFGKPEIMPLKSNPVYHINHETNTVKSNKRFKLLRQVYDIYSDGISDVHTTCRIINVSFDQFRTNVVVSCSRQ